MRRLRAALVACALAAVPAALTAQQTQTPNVHPHPPVTRPQHPVHPHPGASGAYGNYPLLIDGNVVNRFLATPSPKPKRTPAAKPQFGEQTFETHSTNDAR